MIPKPEALSTRPIFGDFTLMQTAAVYERVKTEEKRALNLVNTCRARFSSASARVFMITVANLDLAAELAAEIAKSNDRAWHHTQVEYKQLKRGEPKK